MDKNWIIKVPGDAEKIKHLVESLGVDYPVANLLVQRGINTFEDARNFFRPELTLLHDPFLMQDMEKAIDRLDKAIDTKEKILIYDANTGALQNTLAGVYSPESMGVGKEKLVLSNYKELVCIDMTQKKIILNIPKDSLRLNVGSCRVRRERIYRIEPVFYQ